MTNEGHKVCENVYYIVCLIKNNDKGVDAI